MRKIPTQILAPTILNATRNRRPSNSGTSCRDLEIESQGKAQMSCLDGDAGLAERLKDVLTVLTTEVARGVVVADGVPRRKAKDGAGIALNGSASQLGGGLPDNLGEVAPGVEVRASRGVVRAVEGPVHHLVVVPLVSDAGGSSLDLLAADVARGTPRSKVLTIAAVALVHVVSEDAALGGVLGILGQGVVPLKGGSRVVETVDVVLVENGALVVGAGLGLGRRLRLGVGLRSRLGVRLRSGLGSLAGLRGLGGNIDGGLDDLGSLSGGRSRGGSRRLDKDGLGLDRRLGASGDGDGNNLENPLGLHGALVDGAGHGEQGARRGEEERGLHFAWMERSDDHGGAWKFEGGTLSGQSSLVAKGQSKRRLVLI